MRQRASRVWQRQPQGGFREVSLAELQAMQPEAPFQAGVVAEAQLRGWKCLLVRPVRIERSGQIRYETPFGADGKGWPDMTLVREVTLYRECKSATGRLRPEQEEWRDALIAAGQSWAIWTPADRDAISRELSHRWVRGWPPELKPCSDRWCCGVAK